MRGARTRPWVALAALAAAGCSQPTQVFVHVDAEPGVRELAGSVRVRIWGRGADMESFPAMPSGEETGYPGRGGADWPWVVALAPRDDDASRYWRVEAMAQDESAAMLAVARVASNYQEGRSVHVYLLLEDSCIGRACEDLDSTCANARCQPLGDPVTFSPEAGVPRRDAGPGMDGGPMDSGVDGCVASAEVCDGVDNDCDGSADEGFDLGSDLANCGSCGNACPNLPNARVQCTAGGCAYTCDLGYYDCDASPDCETPSSSADCGGCGVVCSGPTPVCDTTQRPPACVDACPSGTELCDDTCVNLETNAEHCGQCRLSCEGRPNATRACVAFICHWTCVDPWDDCDGDLDVPGLSNGCEANTDTSVSNCGSCLGVCPNPGQCRVPTCVNGACGSRTGNELGSCSPGGGCPDGYCSGGTCVPTCLPDGGVDAGDGGRSCTFDSDCVDGDSCTYDWCNVGRCANDRCPLCPCDAFDAGFDGGFPCGVDEDCWDGDPCTYDFCDFTFSTCRQETCIGCVCDESDAGVGTCPDPCPLGQYCDGFSCQSDTSCGSCAGGQYCCGGICCDGINCVWDSPSMSYWCDAFAMCDGGVCASD